MDCTDSVDGMDSMDCGKRAKAGTPNGYGCDSGSWSLASVRLWIGRAVRSILALAKEAGSYA